jgi:hypothetical protein
LSNKLSLRAAGVLAASLLAGTAEASPFTVVWTGTVSGSSVTGIAPGDAATITVTLDNGGTSMASQTWGAADVQSAAFAFGSTLTTFVAPFGGSLSFTGSYTTGAGGVLNSVPSFFGGYPGGTDYTSNLAETPDGFTLDGANSMFFANNYSSLVDLDNVGSLRNPAAWTLSPAGGGAVIPELDAAASTGALTLLLGALGLLAERRRKAA